MECTIITTCLYEMFLENTFLIGLVLTVPALLLATYPFSFKGTKTNWEIFFIFIALGFSSLVIGYMSSMSRESGIPALVSALITGFSGYIIYIFFGNTDSKANILGTCLGIIYFMAFLLYGAKIGANAREWHEKLDLPKKIATQEDVLKAARKKRGIEKGDYYSQND